MNVIQPVERIRHPFLDGKTKRMLIDGKWVEAASGKTFESINPATGEVLANVAEGDARTSTVPSARRGVHSTDPGEDEAVRAPAMLLKSPTWSRSTSTS